jgi:hypothetical protein
MMSDVDYIHYRIKEADGLVAVQVSGPKETSRLEVLRYARQYVQDGEITIESKKAGGRWTKVSLWDLM